MKRLRLSRTLPAILAGVAAVALAGCGEIKNRLQPAPGTADRVTVVLAGPPNAFYVGIYEAQALGYFAQTDMHVRLITPSSTQDPLTMVHDGQALIGISSEPSVLLHRNENQPVVSVAALVQSPLPAITIPVAPGGPSGGSGLASNTTRTTRTGRPITRTTTTAATTTAATTTAATTTAATATTTTTKPGQTTTGPSTTPTTTTPAQPDATFWPGSLQQLLARPGSPTYDGLVVVVRKGTIVYNAPLIRRFVQAVARGYRAARANPPAAIDNLIKAVPALASSRGQQLVTLRTALPYLFPSGGKVWGWQQADQWNAFGTWMSNNHLLNNPNAEVDPSTNELLQGQGI